MSEHINKQISEKQMKSIHLYLQWVADELNQQGQTMQNVVKQINKVEIRPTKENLKEMVWREIAKTITGKDSTTFLTKQEVNQIYEVMSAWLAKNFEIDLPFPVDETRQYQKANKIDMPVMNEEYEIK